MTAGLKILWNMFQMTSRGIPVNASTTLIIVRFSGNFRSRMPSKIGTNATAEFSIKEVVAVSVFRSPNISIVITSVKILPMIAPPTNVFRSIVRSFLWNKMTKILTASRNQTANKLNGCNEFIAILENIYEVLLAIITAASSCSLARRFPVL